MVILISAGTWGIIHALTLPYFIGDLNNFIWQVAAIILAVGTLVVDNRFHRIIHQQNYSFRGIDLIIWGFIGCFGFGVGALILVKGCLILYYTSQHASGYPRLTKSQWVNVFISRLNGNSAKGSALIWVATILPVIALTYNSFYTYPGELYYGIFAITGLIVVILDAAIFTKQLHSVTAARRKQERGAIIFAMGIIGCLNFGMGVPCSSRGLQ